jgi:hypothetical protein
LIVHNILVVMQFCVWKMREIDTRTPGVCKPKASIGGASSDVLTERLGKKR